MNVLITGGAGYIGSHAVRALIKAGHNVVILDNLSFGHRESIPAGTTFYENYIQETEKIVGILRKHEIGCVMHFAAFISVGESVREPLMYYHNNTAGALSLLLAMKTAGVDRFVFSSTAATYGEPETMPITESTPQSPVNPYGWSKWCVERILKDYHASNPKFAFAALRYFNVAGAIEDASIGEDHKPETHLIPKVLFAALGKEETITVFGTDYPTPDGTCVRDYVHVCDLVDAHVLSMNALKDGDSRFYNLGIGHGYSVREILESAKRGTKREIPVIYGSRREGDPAYLFADSTKIRTELGWKPRFTEIDEIIATAWKWHTDHPEGY